MKKLTKFLYTSLLGAVILLTPLTIYAAHGGAGAGGFTFSYNIGTIVTNYHVYNVVEQVGCSGTQPVGTVILGIWYVKDLGPVTGTGTVVCTAPICPTGKSQSTAGFLLFADASDVGGDGSTYVFTHPVADIEQFYLNWYGGNDFVGMIEPDHTGITLYFGPRLTPFFWDLSPYVY